MNTHEEIDQRILLRYIHCRLYAILQENGALAITLDRMGFKIYADELRELNLQYNELLNTLQEVKAKL